MANTSIQNLLQTIDAIKAEGKQPKVVKLPSQAKRNRKSMFTPPSRGKGMIKCG